MIYRVRTKNSLLAAIGESANGDTIVVEYTTPDEKDWAEKLKPALESQMRDFGKDVKIESKYQAPIPPPGWCYRQ